MEEYQYGISQVIAETLDDANIFYTHQIRNDQEHLLIPFSIPCGPTALMTLINDDDTTDTAIRVLGLLNDIPEDKRESVARTCNKLNNIVRYVKFTLDEDGDVAMEYDLPLTTPRDAVGAMILEMFSRIRCILRDHYQLLAKALYLTENNVSFDLNSIKDFLSTHREIHNDYVDADESD